MHPTEKHGIPRHRGITKQRAVKNLIFFLLVCVAAAVPIDSQADPHTIAVLLSRKIKPYIQILKGLEQGLEKKEPYSLDIFTIQRDAQNKNHIKTKLIEKKYGLFLGIGPEAAELIWSMAALRHRGKLFSGILHPQKIHHINESSCGISLQIPVSTQLAEITTSLPDIKKIGLLFDPAHNLFFSNTAGVSGRHLGVEIIPLKVNSRSDIPRILKNNINGIDSLWMIPDPTVITKKIVQYVIKQALYRKKGVIGYNGFFIKSGAIFAFELDYQQIGIQTADKVAAHFAGEKCDTTVPSFKKTINAKILRQLDMQTKERQK